MERDDVDETIAKLRRSSDRAEIVGLTAILLSWLGTVLLLSSAQLWIA